MDVSISSARIGGVRSNFPGSKLFFSPDEMTLKVPLLGTYKFLPNDIIRFEQNTGLYGANVLLVHNVMDYPQKISIDYKGGAQALTLMLNQHGFIPKRVADTSLLRKGFPVSWFFLIHAILLWNALLIYGKISDNFSLYSSIAISLMFLMTILIPRSKILQNMVLKQGRRVGEIKPTLNLLKWISGILLAFSLISYFIKNI